MESEPTFLSRRQDSRQARRETGPKGDTAFRYDHDYREAARLASGLNIVFRTVHPDDKGLLSEGIARLSPTSRFNRFVTVKNSLSQGDLRYLTEVDGLNHFALGAVRLLPGGFEHGIGVARFVRPDEDPEIAEPAVTVLDEWQGQGVGTGLLRRLVEAARERGIKKFRCDFFADNQEVCGLLDEFGHVATLRTDTYGVVTMEIPLPPPRPDEHSRATLKKSLMYRALLRVAQGVLSPRRRHHLRRMSGTISAAGKATLALLEPTQSSVPGPSGHAHEGASSSKAR
jgi:GNAT superfamily N-acetyltransferase